MIEITSRSVRPVFRCSVAAIAAALLAQPGFAQEAADTPAAQAASADNGSDIVVTARRRGELLRDVPVAVTAFSSKTIQDSNIQRAEDFALLTPGVVMSSGAVEPGDTPVTIRGLSSTRDGTANFAYLIDGILYPNPWGFNREYEDVAQIEIAKGPQGAVYGRNAAAGAIIITTKKPTQELSGSLHATAGENNSYFISGALSGGIAPGIATRLSGSFRTTDGFFKNRLLGVPADNFKSFEINSRTVFEASDRLNLDLKGRFAKTKASAVVTNVAFMLPGAVGALGPAAWEDVNEHPFDFISNRDSSSSQRTIEVSLKADYDMDWAALTVWGLYSNIKQSLIGDGTSGSSGLYFNEPSCRRTIAELNASGLQTGAPGVIGTTPETSVLLPYGPSTCDGYQYQERSQRDISFEARLSSPASQRLRWMIGGYYVRENRSISVGQYVDDGRPALPHTVINELVDSLQWDRYRNRDIAGFGQLAYDVVPTVEASIALRYDSERRAVTNLVPPNLRSRFVEIAPDAATGGYTGGYPLNAALVMFDAAGNPIGFRTSIPKRSQKFNKFQPKATLRWKMTPDITMFGSYGIGFKSGGFNSLGASELVQTFFNTPLGTNLIVNDAYPAEVSKAAEIGIKGNLLNGLVSFDIEAYRNRVKNMQFFEFLVGQFGLLRAVTTIERAEIKGVDLGLTVNPTRGLSFNGALSLIDSKIKENRSRPVTVGNKVPNAPDYTLTLGTTYKAPITNSLDATVHFDFTRTGPTWFHTFQNDVSVIGADFSKSRRDGFNIVNGRIAIESGPWSLAIFGRNIFNTKTVTEVISAPEAGGAFINPYARRQLGAEALFRF
nr:TonB-dependent receptor [Sphingomonas sp. Y57]